MGTFAFIFAIPAFLALVLPRRWGSRLLLGGGFVAGAALALMIVVKPPLEGVSVGLVALIAMLFLIWCAGVGAGAFVRAAVDRLSGRAPSRS